MAKLTVVCESTSPLVLPHLPIDDVYAYQKVNATGNGSEGLIKAARGIVQDHLPRDEKGTVAIPGRDWQSCLRLCPLQPLQRL